jgi:hypothetical protein
LLKVEERDPDLLPELLPEEGLVIPFPLIQNPQQKARIQLTMCTVQEKGVIPIRELLPDRGQMLVNLTFGHILMPVNPIFERISMTIGVKEKAPLLPLDPLMLRIP